MNETRHGEAHAPFDTTRHDALLEDEGIEVLFATSKHNVQYLLGGYRFFFFAVTEEGCVGFGDQGRDWNRAG